MRNLDNSHLSSSTQQALAGPSVVAQPSTSMSEREVLQTMESLMSSMSSGDWSKIMPDQFYSLLDSLQEIDGLDTGDIDQLEESYTKYLKLQGTFDDFQDDVVLKPELLQPASQQNYYPTTHENVSPYGSPYGSPHHQSPLLTHSTSPIHSRNSSLLDGSYEDALQSPQMPYNGVNMTTTINMATINNTQTIPVDTNTMLSRHSPTSMHPYGSSPVSQQILSTSPNKVFQMHQHNENTLGTSPTCYKVINPQTINQMSNRNPGYNPQMNRSNMASVTQGANIYDSNPVGNQPVTVEDDDDDFDWSTIM